LRIFSCTTLRRRATRPPTKQNSGKRAAASGAVKVAGSTNSCIGAFRWMVMPHRVSMLGCDRSGNRRSSGPERARSSRRAGSHAFGSMCSYWDHWSINHGKLIDVEPECDTIGGHFLLCCMAVAHPRRGCARCTRPQSLRTPARIQARHSTARVIAAPAPIVSALLRSRIGGSKTRRATMLVFRGSEPLTYGTPDELEADIRAVSR